MGRSKGGRRKHQKEPVRDENKKALAYEEDRKSSFNPCKKNRGKIVKREKNTNFRKETAKKKAHRHQKTFGEKLQNSREKATTIARERSSNEFKKP